MAQTALETANSETDVPTRYPTHYYFLWNCSLELSTVLIPGEVEKPAEAG